jgi:hypothetical protein
VLGTSELRLGAGKIANQINQPVPGHRLRDQMRLDTRKDGGLVFRAKRGGRMSQQTMAGYWGKVTARACLEFDFYLATKHYCVHYMHTVLQVSPRAIAAQMRWRLANVLKLLEVYGHGDIGALEEVDRAYATNVVSIRDASKTHSSAGRAS